MTRYISRAYVVLVLGCVCLGAGCASYRQAYTGEPKTDSQVALLRVVTRAEKSGIAEANNWNGRLLVEGTGRVFVSRIDGQACDRSSWIELLPGRHRVEWSYEDHLRTGKGEFSFDAQAGRIYSLFFGKILRSTNVLVASVDITDTPFADRGRKARAKYLRKLTE